MFKFELNTKVSTGYGNVEGIVSGRYQMKGSENMYCIEYITPKTQNTKQTWFNESKIKAV